ncbi:Retrovirus-related Pol polyprotein [Labeo rohita]|uniref:ribonuclease H n=1 Tax=Labeo rohita TaxID=84645 RepID=A0ABQ8L5W8_LABRO|nr:Retrovirus-related Pol polyprotein [Labeo rohita]
MSTFGIPRVIQTDQEPGGPGEVPSDPEVIIAFILCGAWPTEDETSSQKTSSSDHVGNDGVRFPSQGIIEGRLNNSEMLTKLVHHLPYLSSLERSDVLQLVESFPHLFSDVPSCTTMIEHDIDVGDALPIKQHAYRVNPMKRELLKREVAYLLNNNLAEASFSAWSSPCLLVNKPDGSYRFCTDYRKLNSVTKPNCYPLPRIDDCVDRVGSAKFVSKFDLLKGYWQVPLTAKAKELSAFVTPDDFLQYRVMPFGVRNAPATFQRLVNRVLSRLSGCVAYLDDVILYSSSWADHLVTIRELFVRLTEASLTLNLAKCEFGKATVTYLGKVVGNGQVRPIEAKIESICAFPVPANRRELRRFLGMAGYYRGFCQNFASIVAPLTDLISTKVPFEWTTVSQQAFDGAKALLASAPVLVAPDFSQPFCLAVDASETGVGAVLLQKSQISPVYRLQIRYQISHAFTADCLNLSRQSYPVEQLRRKACLMGCPRNASGCPYPPGMDTSGSCFVYGLSFHPSPVPAYLFDACPSVERRLLKDPEKAETYRAEMHRLLEAGAVCVVPDPVTDTPECWYIPHHMVSHNGKSHLVFNCSHQYRGQSLNRYLLPRPTHGASLLGVLLRFREHPVAVSGDIKAMFHQVHLLSEDRLLLRFLWRDLHMDEAPQTLEAKSLIDCLRTVLSEAGFEIRQWASNDPAVLSHLPPEARATSVELWLTQEKTDVTESTLGLSWNWQSDTLSYKLRPVIYKTPTLRNIYRVLATQYDPLGLLLPYTTHAKVIIKHLWNKQREWDDPHLPPDLLHSWMQWEEELRCLPNVSFPRPYVPPAAGIEGNTCEVHIFSDALEQAYGAISYLCTVDPAEWLVLPAPSDDPTELRKSTFCGVVASPTTSSHPDRWSHSTWLDLLDATVRDLRGDPNSDTVPEAADYHQAEVHALKHVQQESFPEDYHLLEFRMTVKPSSHLVALAPEIDPSNGLIRVGGRLRRVAELADSVLHPIILDSRHPVAHLIIRHYDNQLHHLGSERLFAEIRRHYWILRGREAVRWFQHTCPECRRWRGQPSVPLMSDLPGARLQLYKPAFHSCGMDYFGPFLIKIGRRTEKRWGVLFECLTTRAVHLDLLPSLSTDSFLMALRRFIARRGTPAQLCQIKGPTSVEKIQFCFNPPAAPHFGGVWEREVRSVRSALYTVLGSQSVPEEVLMTVLLEVEAILNSKPVGYVSSDVADADPVTPSSLLMGWPDGSLPQVIYPESEMLSRRRWRHSQILADRFWSRFIRDYLPSLQTRQKWQVSPPDLQKHTYVMIVDLSCLEVYGL